MLTMKQRWMGVLAVVGLCLAPVVGLSQSDPVADKMAQTIRSYFETCFADLKVVADSIPTEDTFRTAMKPVVEKTDGFFGGTLISPEFEIQQVYFKRNFLAKGFDLKKVKQLTYFVGQMKENPAPQLSEPGHGSLIQPRLVAMRYPVMKDGKVVNIVSMMIRTEKFLEAVGLDKVAAYRFICLDQVAEEMGALSDSPHRVVLELPSTKWEVLFN